jgi:hypothetical protein
MLPESRGKLLRQISLFGQRKKSCWFLSNVATKLGQNCKERLSRIQQTPVLDATKYGLKQKRRKVAKWVPPSPYSRKMIFDQYTSIRTKCSFEYIHNHIYQDFLYIYRRWKWKFSEKPTILLPVVVKIENWKLKIRESHFEVYVVLSSLY